MWELKGAKERLKIFEADLTVEGSFDEAVKGVDGVFHIASRVTVCLDKNDLVNYSLLLLENNLIFYFISIKVVEVLEITDVFFSLRRSWSIEI